LEAPKILVQISIIPIIFIYFIGAWTWATNLNKKESQKQENSRRAMRDLFFREEDDRMLCNLPNKKD